MNEVKSTKTEEKYTDANGDEQTRTIVNVSIESHGWQDMVARYGFNAKQREMLEKMMAPEYYDLYMQLLGMTPSPFENMTVEEMNLIVSNLPPGNKTTELVKLGLSKLGTPYSNGKRSSEGYYDCSSFTYRMYKEFGLDLSYEGSNVAAAQAEWCVSATRLALKRCCAC